MVGGLFVVSFLLLAPGFIVMQIVEWLWPSGHGGYREKLVGSVGMSLLVYLVYNLFALIPHIGPQVARFALTAQAIGLSTDFQVSVYQLTPGSVTWLVLICVGLGLLVSRILTSGSLFRLLAKLGISYETGEHGVWNQAILQDAQGCMARVYLRDGTVVEGWLSAHSDNPARRDLWMKRVPASKEFGNQQQVWISLSKEDPGRNINGPGILLVSPDIARIEFLDCPVSEGC